MSTDLLLKEIAIQSPSSDKQYPNYDEIDTKRRTLANNDYEQDIKLRRVFAWSIFGFVTLFVFSILVLVYLCAYTSSSFALSDPVFIALLTTMTSTIVGLLVFVVKYLFSKATYHQR